MAEDEGTAFLRNVGKHLASVTVSHPKRLAKNSLNYQVETEPRCLGNLHMFFYTPTLKAETAIQFNSFNGYLLT
jgi:hypothetical protein